MIRTDRKSDCAINFSLEAVGDPWSLLVVRDLAFYNKTGFGEFLSSQERIGSNTLTRRLRRLEDQGIIARYPDPHDGRKDRYRLTEKGWALVPILVELTIWGAAYDPDTGASPASLAAMQRNRETYPASIRAAAGTDLSDPALPPCEVGGRN